MHKDKKGWLVLGPRKSAHPSEKRALLWVFGFTLVFCSLMVSSVHADPVWNPQGQATMDMERAWLRWRSVASQLEDVDEPTLIREADRLRSALNRHGIGRARRLARALINGARRDGAFSRELIERARLLAPLSPEVFAGQINAIVAHDRQRWSRLPIETIDFFRASLSEYGSRIRLYSILVTVFLIGSFVAVFLFLLNSFLRCIPLLHHRLGHFSLFEVPYLLFFVAVLSLLGLSVLQGFGVLLPMLVASVLLGVLQDSTTRRSTISVLLLWAALPWLAGPIWEDLSYRGSVLPLVVECEDGFCDPWVEDLIQQTDQGTKFTGVSFYALGVHATRSGHLDRGRHLLDLSRNTKFEDPALFVAMGNAHLLELARFCSDPGSAAASNDAQTILVASERLYRKALALDPGCTAAQFNLAMLLERLGKSAEAKRLFDQYMSTTGGLVPNTYRKESLHRSYTGCSSEEASIIGGVAWGRLNEGTLKSLNRDGRPAAMPVSGIPFHEIFLGRVSSLAASLIAFLFSIVFWFQGAMSRIRLTTRSCVSCGSAFCGRCGAFSRHGQNCNRCLMESLHISLTDPQDLWLKKAKKVRALRVRARIALFAGLFLPGLGHLIGTRPLRGLVLVVLSLTCFAVFLGPMGLIPAWPSAWGWRTPGIFFTPVLALVCLYAFGIPNAFQARRDILG